MTDSLLKPEKRIFVIMPFRETSVRNAEQLMAFFESSLKRPIEHDESFFFRYRVSRSDNRFNITREIVSDLFHADIVICDLSGRHGNPSVMYELGVRLACSENPVILIREEHPDNERIFDIAGFHAFSYDPFIPERATDYIRQKIRAFEAGEEDFRSPVLEVIGSQVPALRIGRERAVSLMNILEVGLLLSIRSFISGINDYLVVHLERDDLRLGEPGGGYYSELFEIESQIQELDWSEIRLILGPHPALTHYLSSNYLNGLIPGDLEISFSVELMRYHSAYFLEATWWLRFDIEKGSRFVEHTQSVMVLCRLMKNLLTAVDRNQQDLFSRNFEEFVRGLRSSVLI